MTTDTTRTKEPPHAPVLFGCRCGALFTNLALLLAHWHYCRKVTL